MNRYARICQQGPRASKDSGFRRAKDIRWIVVHSAEGTSAGGVAAWFARKNATASTQLAVDDSKCIRMLPDLIVPWGAPGANENGVHVELCGYARWSRAEWLSHMDMLQMAAYRCAVWCHAYKIPPRWLHRWHLRVGRVRGITTHNEVSLAFRKSNHWDPGQGFPRDVFLKLVKVHLKEIKA